MFRELAPLLRQRAVLLTVTHLEEDQIRVNVVPKQVGTGDNTALTTPFSVTGTAEELDEQLPQAFIFQTRALPGSLRQRARTSRTDDHKF